MREDMNMNYTITEKPSFKVAGKALRVSTKDGENMRRIPQFWDECHADGTHDRLVALAVRGAVLGDVTLGICADFAANMEEFTYMIAAESTETEVPDGLVERAVPALTWAVFTASGPMPDAIQNLWGQIWSDFFPAGQFTHGDGPDLELYPSSDPSSPDYTFQVWVPVVKQD
jgi:AraC family transcriptional regulator